MTPVEKVGHLIRKALSTDSVEEARTCALSAVQIMVKEKLTVVSDSELEALRYRAMKPAPARAPVRPRKRSADAPSVTGYDSSCLFCGCNLPKGSKVFWSQVFGVMVCPDCFEAEILVKDRVDSRWEKG